MGLREEELNNEVRALEKLRMPGDPNIPRVFIHGLPESGDCYFIDVELCQYSLGEYMSVNSDCNPADKSSQNLAEASTLRTHVKLAGICVMDFHTSMSNS